MKTQKGCEQGLGCTRGNIHVHVHVGPKQIKPLPTCTHVQCTYTKAKDEIHVYSTYVRLYRSGLLSYASNIHVH